MTSVQQSVPGTTGLGSLGQSGIAPGVSTVTRHEQLPVGDKGVNTSVPPAFSENVNAVPSLVVRGAEQSAIDKSMHSPGVDGGQSVAPSLRSSSRHGCYVQWSGTPFYQDRKVPKGKEVAARDKGRAQAIAAVRTIFKSCFDQELSHNRGAGKGEAGTYYGFKCSNKNCDFRGRIDKSTTHAGFYCFHLPDNLTDDLINHHVKEQQPNQEEEDGDNGGDDSSLESGEPITENRRELSEDGTLHLHSSSWLFEAMVKNVSVSSSDLLKRFWEQYKNQLHLTMDAKELLQKRVTDFIKSTKKQLRK